MKESEFYSIFNELVSIILEAVFKEARLRIDASLNPGKFKGSKMVPLQVAKEVVKEIDPGIAEQPDKEPNRPKSKIHCYSFKTKKSKYDWNKLEPVIKLNSTAGLTLPEISKAMSIPLPTLYRKYGHAEWINQTKTGKKAEK